MDTIARASALLLLLSTTPLPAAETPTVDEVIDSYIEARGGHEALAAIEAVVYSQGRYSEPGFESEGSAFMALARPYFKVVGNPENPGGYMEGYDGAAWEWFADPGIAIRTVGEASAASRHGAYLDGPLVDYRERGAAAELGSLTPIGDRSAWPVTLTARDGFRVDYFIDVETRLLIAERMSAPIHAWGEPVTRETRVGDYRPVAGVLFPHHFAETDIATGERLSEMRWGRIEARAGLPRWWFAPPTERPGAADRSPLQRFLEHLYVQRADVEAVLWTYADFRRTHPDVATSAGVELIGYQMLKMGDVPTAIRLLEANAADHPEAASAAYGLGRAYATSGRNADARRSLEQALSLDPEHPGARRALAALDGR